MLYNTDKTTDTRYNTTAPATSSHCCAAWPPADSPSCGTLVQRGVGIPLRADAGGFCLPSAHLPSSLFFNSSSVAASATPREERVQSARRLVSSDDSSNVSPLRPPASGTPGTGLALDRGHEYHGHSCTYSAQEASMHSLIAMFTDTTHPGYRRRRRSSIRPRLLCLPAPRDSSQTLQPQIHPHIRPQECLDEMAAWQNAQSDPRQRWPRAAQRSRPAAGDQLDSVPLSCGRCTSSCHDDSRQGCSRRGSYGTRTNRSAYIC